MNKDKKIHIFVIGNEKGGVGKTTCSMHLISGLLSYGLKVASIDTDSRQQSLTTYINNRRAYNSNNPQYTVAVPEHFVLEGDKTDNPQENRATQTAAFQEALARAAQECQVVVIDTPGSHSFLSSLAHSYADTIITPINDSFIDLDVLAKVDKNLRVLGPSIYSEMIWQQKIERARRNGGSIDWIVMQNRLNTVRTVNKRNISTVLHELEQRLRFKIAPGFSERVIFRELFVQGLTLLDLSNIKRERSLNISHIAARQELKKFLQYLNFNLDSSHESNR